MVGQLHWHFYICSQAFACQQVVKKEDVTKFFESFQARKRQRLGEGPGVQYKCR